MKKDEIFDARIEETDLKITPQQKIEISREKAEKEKELRERLKDYDYEKQRKKTYRSCVIASVVSISLGLFLSIIFIVFLRWYAIGLVCAIITFIGAQVWIHFFKKLNKKELDAQDIELENELQMALNKKEQERLQVKENNTGSYPSMDSILDNTKNLKTSSDSKTEVKTNKNRAPVKQKPNIKSKTKNVTSSQIQVQSNTSKPITTKNKQNAKDEVN